MTGVGALAHGLTPVQDLPVPLWLFYYGGALVLLVSFVALGVLWRRSRLETAGDGVPLGDRLQNVLLSRALRIGLGALSFATLALVLAAALLGEPSASRNLAPTFVWVIFWLGLVPVVVVFGNVWSVLNPWRAAADAVAWSWSRAGRSWDPIAYPARLGRWPAAGLLLAFTALELAYTDPASPRALGFAILLYSSITWYGMLAFGRRAWLANGEAFSVYFGLLSSMAPFAVREDEEHGRRVVARAPLVGLTRVDPRPGTLAFVAVMLGSVGFDGFSRTTVWQDFHLSVIGSTLPESRLGELASMLVNLGGLVFCVLLVASAYVVAVAAARAVGQTQRPLVDAFLASLVPIALVYAVAHYFSLFVYQGQFAIPLASDPFGWGWDLLGTRDFTPNLTLLSADLIWYVQVGALVTGHVIGLTLAHDRALALFRSAKVALRTQYAMLVLMVLYTVGGLWILSQG